MMEKVPGKFDESDVEKITPEKLAKMFVAFYEFQKATADPDLFHRELEHYMNVYNRGRNGYIFAGKGSNHKCEKSIIEVVEKIENPTIKEDFYHAGAKALYNFARIGEPKFQQPDPEFDLEKRYDKTKYSRPVKIAKPIDSTLAFGALILLLVVFVALISG